MPIERRRLLLLAGLIPLVSHRAVGIASARPTSATVDAAKYPTLQAAVNAAPDGSTIVSTSGTTYGPVLLVGRRNLTLSGLTIAGKVQLNSCTSCAINQCTVIGDSTGTSIFMVRPVSCTISYCTVTRGSIGGYSLDSCSIRNNTIRDAPGNAIGVAGFADAPAQRNTYSYNNITNCGRIAIEEWGERSTYCTDTAIYNNTILNSVAMGISAVGINPDIHDNIITNFGYAGIEVGGTQAQVASNQISSNRFEGSGIHVNSTAAGVVANAAVRGNTLTGLRDGILLIANDPSVALRNVSVTNNAVTNVSNIAISGNPAFSGGGNIVGGNTITFDSPATPGTNRTGIGTGSGLIVQGNRVQYQLSSAGGGTDLPVHLVGNNVTMDSNELDGGGRSDPGLLAASAVAPPRTYAGWKYLTNRYSNGARIDKSGTVAVTDTDYR